LIAQGVSPGWAWYIDRVPSGRHKDRLIILYVGSYQLPNSPNYLIKKALMANTATLSKDERKKLKRAARKKRKTEHPLKPREYARGSKKSKVKKLVRGQAKR